MKFKRTMPFLLVAFFIGSSCQVNQMTTPENNKVKKISLLTGKPIVGNLTNKILFKGKEADDFLKMSYEQRKNYLSTKNKIFDTKYWYNTGNCSGYETYECIGQDGGRYICQDNVQGEHDSCGRCSLSNSYDIYDPFYGQPCEYTANQSSYMSGRTFCRTSITYSYDGIPKTYPSCYTCGQGEHPIVIDNWASGCEKDSVDFCSTTYDDKGQEHKKCIACGEGYDIKFDDEGQPVGCKLKDQEESIKSGFHTLYEPYGVDGLNKTSIYTGSCQ